MFIRGSEARLSACYSVLGRARMLDRLQGNNTVHSQCVEAVHGGAPGPQTL